MLLWLAIVSEARLFADCARDTVWKALVLAEQPFRVADFDEFWRLKALTEPSLAALSAANRKRQRSVFLRCLREAGFIDDPRFRTVQDHGLHLQRATGGVGPQSSRKCR